jgi:hypothetical protein
LVGERQKGVACPEFNRSISIDFQGATITSDTGFLLFRQLDERYKVLENQVCCHPLFCFTGQGDLSFATNQARLLSGALAYNLIHLLRDIAFWGEKTRP